jgi:hypothetical protein
MLIIEDFEKALEAIDRSKAIPTRLNDLNIDSEELRDWLLVEFHGDPFKVATFGAGLELGMMLQKAADEVHT